MIIQTIKLPKGITMLHIETTLVIYYGDDIECSKVFTTYEALISFVNHIKEQASNYSNESNLLGFQEYISPDNLIKGVYYKLITNNDTKTRKVKFHKCQPRYQDKRRVERILKEFFGKNNIKSDTHRVFIDRKQEARQKLKKERPEKKYNSVKIPIRTDNRTVEYIPEHLLTLPNSEYLKYFKNREELLSRIESYKTNILNI